MKKSSALVPVIAMFVLALPIRNLIAENAPAKALNSPPVTVAEFSGEGFQYAASCNFSVFNHRPEPINVGVNGRYLGSVVPGGAWVWGIPAGNFSFAIVGAASGGTWGNSAFCPPGATYYDDQW